MGRRRNEPTTEFNVSIHDHRSDDEFRGLWILGFPCGPIGPYDRPGEELDSDFAGMCLFYPAPEAEPPKPAAPRGNDIEADEPFTLEYRK